MPYVVGRPKVEDYAKFRRAFDEYGASRKDSGCKSERVFRNADDPNDLVILLEWDDLEKARQFIQSAGLRANMQRAGVVGQPERILVDEV
jgi:quinol monooxygenase YgiN